MFFATTVILAAALAGSWAWFWHLSLQPVALEVPAPPHDSSAQGPVSPLLLHYQLDLPGRGEIFPALDAAGAVDYWPLATLRIGNNSGRPVLQAVSATVPGWSRGSEQTVIVAPHETRVLRVSPELLPSAYSNQEIRRATLQVRVTSTEGEVVFAQDRPVYLHNASDLYWGKQFANAQFLARWVTPHDPSVLRLVANARSHAPRERLPGYNLPHPSAASSFSSQALAAQVRMQANAVFQELRRSRLSYVSSAYTFGSFVDQAQRIRLPRETLSLSTANCIDVSVVFASAMENLDMNPVVVIVPGHAFVGVRLAPQSQETLYLDLTVLPRGTFQQAILRAQHWLKNTAPGQVLTVDVAAARVLGIYPLPEGQQENQRAKVEQGFTPAVGLVRR